MALKWVIRGNQLLTENDPGGDGVPSAADIYAVAIKGEQGRGGLPALNGVASALRFSRFPLSLKFLARFSLAEPSLPPFCSVVAFSDCVETSPITIADGAVDHVIHDGVWYPIVQGAISEVQADLLAAGIGALGVVTLRQYIALREREGSAIPLEERWVDEVWETRAHLGEAALADAGFVGDLYDYQATGYRWLRMVSDEGLGCILADEMGLGKTVQVIALMIRDASRGRGPFLLIAPATLLKNWKRELARFAPGLGTLIHRGGYRTGFPSELKRWDVVLTSYGTAVRDISLLSMFEWDTVVLDEAQAIRNPNAKRTVAMKSIPRRAAIGMTGTPVENSLRDIWSLTDFAVPGLLGRLDDFTEEYEDDEWGAAAVERRVTPVMLRRTLEDVKLELPPKVEIPQILEMSPLAAARYEELRSELAARYSGGASLASLQVLRMYCTHPFLVDKSDGDPVQFSAKYRRLIEILTEVYERQEKTLVFTAYQAMVDMLNEDLGRRFGMLTDWIDGRVKVEERQDRIDRFGETSGAAVMVLNPKAAGTGLNITCANHVIHYNLEWNPAVEDQATARAYRKGQELPVTVHRLFFEGTIEEIMNERLKRKRRIADLAVVGTDGEGDASDIMAALHISPIQKEASKP